MCVGQINAIFIGNANHGEPSGYNTSTGVALETFEPETPGHNIWSPLLHLQQVYMIHDSGTGGGSPRCCIGCTELYFPEHAQSLCQGLENGIRIGIQVRKGYQSETITGVCVCVVTGFCM